MSGRWRMLRRALAHAERGQTMAEYGLVAAVLGMAMLAGVGVMQQAAAGILTAAANGWLGVALNPP